MPAPAQPQLIPPKLLTAVGSALFGDNWTVQLAEASGMSQPMIWMMAAGDRAIVNRDFIGRLAKLCSKRAGELNAHAAKLTEALNKGDV